MTLNKRDIAMNNTNADEEVGRKELGKGVIPIFNCSEFNDVNIIAR
ncbi:30800_t:CDS:2, partial [Gigaspora margarita]